MKQCTKCKEYKTEFTKNKKTRDGLSSWCKTCSKQASYLSIKSNNYKAQKKWKQKNGDKTIKDRKKRLYENRKKDPKWQEINRCRCAIYNSLIKGQRPLKAEKILGIDIHSYSIYLESKFKDGMNWGNYGEWHIDHIFPLSKAKDENHVVELMNYKNTQPLWREENIIKRDLVNEQ